jgi:allophanate hydrolase
MPTSSNPTPRGTSLDLASLQTDYANGRSLHDVARDVLGRIASYNDPAIWICLATAEQISRQIEVIEQRKRDGAVQPLCGVPFAVKDNIDVAGYPTTAACPAFAYTPGESAFAVKRAMDAGAIFIGKTNLDQLASGLVGVRSPYGSPRNPFNAEMVPGGSSSGSAVAVAAGLVSFAFGTDTAGSGRVPAAFNNVVGLKPSRGLISTSGVVPACRSLDCVSVVALTCEDANEVLRAVASPDAQDAESREPGEFPSNTPIDSQSFRFGVPPAADLRFFGNTAAADLYQTALQRLKELGGTPVEIDFSPFAAVGQLLYQGPWVVERLEAAGELLARDPDAILPPTRKILSGALKFTALDAMAAQRRLRGLARAAAKQWAKMDVLALPTVGTIYTVAQVTADPLSLNANLGYYTHFANLLDLCAISIPSGLGPDGLPASLMLLAPAGQDQGLIALGGRYHRTAQVNLGATSHPLPASADKPAQPAAQETGLVSLAVVGAHLAGQPLNHQLLSRKARLVRSCRTAPRYQLYALAGTVPPKPGLLRVTGEAEGNAIDVEVWEMTAEHFGNFVAAIPPPLGIGTIELEDGTVVKGFICEPYAIAGARDISHFGGWRQYLQGAKTDPVPAI